MKSYTAYKTLLVFIILPILTMGQSATLRGIVLNVLNEPLEGVNVVSNNNGATTNSNGFYILKITEIRVSKKLIHFLIAKISH